MSLGDINPYILASNRSPQDHNEDLVYSLGFQPPLTTQELGTPTSSALCMYQAGSSSMSPAEQAAPSQLRSITDTGVKTVVSEDAKEKRIESLGRTGGTRPG